LFFYRKGNSWRLTLAKLYALRVLCYADLNRRMELEHYISHVWAEHEADMLAETLLEQKLPFASLRTMYLTPSEVNFLLFGLESGSSSQSQFCDFLTEFVVDCNFDSAN